MKKLLTLLFTIALTSLFSCDTYKENFDVDGTGSITIKFNFLHDRAPLEYNRQYINALGQNYTLSDFRMYISNLTLRDTSGTNFYKVEDSYHLLEIIEESDTSIVITGLPNKSYSELQFSVGVDNAANYNTDQVGDLDPANGMAWNWDTGYKFMLVEGLHLVDSISTKGLVYHIGGDANYRVVKFSEQEINLANTPTMYIELDVNVDYIFGDKSEYGLPEDQRKTNFIDLNDDTDQDTMFGPNTQKIADNYAQMFTWKDIIGQ
ncbi:MbnP family protein [Flammeovirga kamogawensis]|uniref:Copper-binding protein MbnP-like domain-containing protein n=1 Tax=Flammeovirga kamogawensis TaxID=373891 RepID=A0ABX8GYP3_9BACT|nr:MbnP family protein [Flammeovirga kamogawensis]MBB6458928.1 hypothetical protein [Flammeovirga kamogawensis]QWG08504.1 hypothetical protein KM029_06090 [Flammeovirga kamogawensis]TRX66797.1 hypothetical protein EO216_01140 [Flammeovirga kamogawensis]